MAFELGACRLLNYSACVAAAPPVAPIKAVRQDARAFKRAAMAGAAPAPAGWQVLLQDLRATLDRLVAWLFQRPAAPLPVNPLGPTRFVVSSFNILGSSHTVPGADAAEYDSGPTRIRRAAALLAQKHVAVVGFQEMNHDQVTAFMDETRGTYGIFPGNKTKDPMGSQNSIAWRRDTWDLVDARCVDMVSHHGKLWPAPIIHLRNKQTGREVIFTNFHNAPGFRLGTQQKQRDQATAQQVALLNRLRQETGLPIVVTGDMNQTERTYRPLTQEAGLHAANEGPGGRAPKRMGIDWIFGSAGVAFKGYARERGAFEQTISDHGMISAQALIR